MISVRNLAHPQPRGAVARDDDHPDVGRTQSARTVYISPGECAFSEPYFANIPPACGLAKHLSVSDESAATTS